MDISSNFITPVLGFILVLIFGFWLSNRGRPYSGVLFNIHKLIALGTAILTVLRLYMNFNLMNGQTMILFLVIVGAIGVVSLFASGAFMSIGNKDYKLMKTIHNIAPVVVVVSLGSVMYLLAGTSP